MVDSCITVTISRGITFNYRHRYMFGNGWPIFCRLFPCKPNVLVNITFVFLYKIFSAKIIFPLITILKSTPFKENISVIILVFLNIYLDFSTQFYFLSVRLNSK